MRRRIPEDWATALDGLLDEPWVDELEDWLRAERARGKVFPPENRVFTALTNRPCSSGTTR